MIDADSKEAVVVAATVLNGDTLTDGLQAWVQLFTEWSILLPFEDQRDWARQQLLQ